MALAFADCKGSALRFVALYNEVTEGKTRTAAELYYQLQRVAEARAFAVAAQFYAALDAVIDGVATGVVAPTVPTSVATDESLSAPTAAEVRAAAFARTGNDWEQAIYLVRSRWPGSYWQATRLRVEDGRVIGPGGPIDERPDRDWAPIALPAPTIAGVEQPSSVHR